MTRIFIAGLLFLLIGCGNNALNLEPHIRYGNDTCSDCRMIINEEPFAAAIIVSPELTVKFDSISCLLRYHQENPSVGGTMWVHDFDTRQWVNARSAFFVQSKDILTPMGDGLLAFSSRDSAQAWVNKTKGTFYEFSELSKIQISKGGVVS
ncbi:MAG: nitrous oxide reductase accessory protein NosL [Candidatus Omnitrophica bacterium]|nr:nitrous oxide reductase accessory protein NosL [Candidatus Omnitrophota bacterium]